MSGTGPDFWVLVNPSFVVVVAVVCTGPDFWGLVNPEWSLCSKGRRQSPINVEPRNLLYDPQLKHIRIDKHKVKTPDPPTPIPKSPHSPPFHRTTINSNIYVSQTQGKTTPQPPHHLPHSQLPPTNPPYPLHPRNPLISHNQISINFN